MSQFEFMSRLRRCLAGLPEEEIDRAVEYYEDYFADAGMGDEEVIAKLGSPEKIAENIRKEILGKQENTAEGSFTERGFETEKERENFQELDQFSQVAQSKNPYENENNSSQNQSGTYHYSESQEREQYYYDDRKERKKNRKFIVTLLTIFGIIWLCIVMFIAAIYLLFSTRKVHEHNVIHEVGAEVEQAVEEGFGFFDDGDEVSADAEENGDTVSGNAQIKPDQDIEGLKIDVKLGKVVIKKGGEFSAEITKNDNNRKIKSTVKNGVWELKEKDSGFDLKNLLNHMKKGGFHLVITVPEGFEAEKIKIKVDAGKVEAGSLTAKKADLEVDTGTIKIENLVVTEEAEMAVDMGKIEISSGKVKNLDLECDMGKATYGGILTGKNKIVCDMGSVEIKLEDEAENYTFSISNDMGKINLDGKTYKGTSYRLEKGSGEHTIYLEVDMGAIEVETGKG